MIALHCAHLVAVQVTDEGKPVWRKVLQHLLNHSDPAVAQQAAAALTE
jgi:hypothetical protein